MAIKKSVSFKDDEIDMVKYADSQLSFSIYIKTLIKNDMSKKEENNNRTKKNTGFELDF